MIEARKRIGLETSLGKLGKEGAIAEENQVLKIYHWYAARQEPKMVDSGVL